MMMMNLMWMDLENDLTLILIDWKDLDLMSLCCWCGFCVPSTARGHPQPPINENRELNWRQWDDVPSNVVVETRCVCC